LSIATASIEKIYIAQDISYFSFGRDCASVAPDKITTDDPEAVGDMRPTPENAVQNTRKQAEN
jgi:hypothetical protein